jgi:hypothetical protein
MENEQTNKTAEQEKSGEKDTGFKWCQDCCEGMSMSEEMKKEMMSCCKKMDEPSGMAAMFKGFFTPRKSEKA